ncbi:hypothetical protein U8326_00090 [Tsuneonella sp. CC-YZS046]|uniref:hypothetical protein n=1 Tax=Tsuneonella sp. CC-YZS046 TaxID=3042152 RepID=UPI002D78C32E|nr:hypothetical protein [Tsuneonella sp. CC-YZS046]WRO66603.1 hypothetical protein U8326_00090 [Tsuneonella sp. CC-YZS046]
MRLALFAGVLLSVAPLGAAAFAQTTPYKLIITWYQSNLTVIDYPTKERCEAAAKAITVEVERQLAESNALAPNTILLSKGPNGAFCIPG